MTFIAYQHVETFGRDEVAGIDAGPCHIFPKLDGTNGSIWCDSGRIRTGSRRRDLTDKAEDRDNFGFNKWVNEGPYAEKFKALFEAYPDWRLFGEWLVPHTIKNYRKDAWNRFWVFDVCVGEKEESGNVEHLHYDVYAPVLAEFGIDYIPVEHTATNPPIESLQHWAATCAFLCEDGTLGEGIVIKNYGFRNRYGRTTWAKIVRQQFKEENKAAFGAANHEFDPVEAQIAERYLTEHVVDKEVAKIIADVGGWSGPCIPRLLNTTFHTVVTEDLWDAIKRYKNPVVDFKRLRFQCIARVKQLRPDLF